MVGGRYGHGTSDMHGTPPAPWADAKPAADQPPPIKLARRPPRLQPALLLGCSDTGGHHDGRIAIAAPEPDGWAIVEMWVSQGMLFPA